jgi:uncharacterized protein YchJ
MSSAGKDYFIQDEINRKSNESGFFNDIPTQKKIVWKIEDDEFKKTEEIIITKRKQNRNDICNCGSGKKYKYCCLIGCR